MKKFQKVEVRKPQSSVFDFSHERKMSIKFGKLYPMYLQEIIPGDRFRVSSELMARFAPMLAPIMHRIHVYTHFFFVPNRLIWDGWQDFITGGDDGLNTLATHPRIRLNNTTKANFVKGRLPDYFGIPPQTGTLIDEVAINALPFRAYWKIWNEYYRDTSIQAEFEVPTTNGIDDTDIDKLTSLATRAWEKDYFTSCLPWPQRGGEVELPIEGTVDPVYKSVSDIKKYDGTVPSGTLTSATGYLQAAGANSRIENLNQMEVNFSALTVDELRQAQRLQEWLEKNARGGSRYIEMILSHFGIKSSDARLQRPEYLGGGKTNVVISEVLQTAEGTDAVGDMKGHGISVGKSNRFTTQFEEHGFVIGLVSVMPVTTYQQGLPRVFLKDDKFDYYWPEFARLGEQEVKKGEVMLDLTTTTKDQLFGYQERYAEYKYMPSSVHGDFRDTLSFWHLGRQFSAIPSLSENFILCDADDRIFAVQDGTDYIWMQIYNDVKAIRLMPYIGTPSII